MDFQTTFRPGLKIFRPFCAAGEKNNFRKGEKNKVSDYFFSKIERAERVDAIFDVIFTFWPKIGVQKSTSKFGLQEGRYPLAN